MKKYIKYLLMVMVVCFSFLLNVKADVPVKIKSTKLVTKSASTKVLSDPKFNGTDLKLDLQLYKVGDYAEYKVTLSNTLNEPVVISNNGKSITKANDFLVYNYIWEDSDSTIPAKGTKSFNLKVEYASPVKETSFDSSGNYIATDTIKIELNTDSNAAINKEYNNNSKIKNIIEDSPETEDNISDYLALSIIAITLTFDFIYFGIIKKENKKTNKIILITSGIFIIISLVIKITFAMVYYSINVTTSIKISKLPVMARSCDSYKYTTDYIITNYEDKYYLPFMSNPSNSNCIDWSELVPYDMEKVMEEYGNPNISTLDIYSFGNVQVVVTTTKNMPEKYTYNKIEFGLDYTKDISANKDGSVMLGVYKLGDATLLLIGGEGGVAAPHDSSFLFSALGDISDNANFYRETGWEIDPENLMYLVNTFDLKNLDVSNVENMNGMFALASGFLLYKFDVSTWNTANLKHMNIMFYQFSVLTPAFYIDLNHFNTSKVTDMVGTFVQMGSSTASANLSINNWDTSSVTNMAYMFNSYAEYSPVFNLNLSKWNTKNVTNMSHTFASAGSGTMATFNLNLSGWDTSKVTTMDKMFSYIGHNAAESFVSINNMTLLPSDVPTMFEGHDENSITLLTVKDCNTVSLIRNNALDFYGNVVSAKDPLSCSY